MTLQPAHPNQINFGWLIWLRWSMIAGQLVALLGVRIGLGIELPLRQLLAIIALETTVNLFAIVVRRRREVREWWLAAVMAFDIVAFTALLYLTGGPSNPFSFLYLVQIALAAITLRAGWTWALVGLALNTVYQMSAPMPSGHMDSSVAIGFHVLIWAIAIALLVYALRMRRSGMIS